ncbi:MAG: EFR1 family ferrodoxin [Eubacteriales bacterium]|nr:EFR1 family ferrodoxin [Eubacteriales bacterium]
MILYFSGTGNSEYVAKRIGNGLGDEVLNLFDRIRNSDSSRLHSERPWVLVVPTYAWRIPRIVENWLRKATLSGSKEIYFVMTCGGSIGNAGAYTEALCSHMGMQYRGCQRIVMPENYIAMFGTPGPEEARRIIEKAEPVMDEIIEKIRNGEAFLQPSTGVGDKINSSFVNTIFYPVFVHSRKFFAEESCISCGKCEKVCPLNNIHMENGKPVWGDNCTHCMACISRCPKEAIEYRKKSKGKVRYTCPK